MPRKRMDHRERWKMRRRRAHRCITCPSSERTDTTLCSRCRARLVAKYQARRVAILAARKAEFDRRVAAGLCVKPGCPEEVTRYRRCLGHRMRQAAMDRGHSPTQKELA